MRPIQGFESLCGKFTVTVLTTMAALLLATTVAAQEDPVARVMKFAGDVQLRRLVDTDFSAQLQPTMPLFSGDALRVGTVGFLALIFIDDKTLIKVKPNTEFQIVETQNTRTLMLDYGSLRSTLPQPVKDFRIETPVSVASVKGTDFWLIHDATAGIDRAYGIEGTVEVLNVISGLTQTLTANTMIFSTASGQISPPVPISPDEIPSDPEGLEDTPTEPEAEPESGPEQGEATPEPGQAATPAAQAAAAAAPAPAPVAVAEEAAEEPAESKPSGKGLGLGLGSVTIDGEVFYQIALRPELTFGKIGIGLDLVAYMDAEGRFRKDEWDEPSDYLDKLYYLRYATEQDPFFLRIGAMPAVQYGFGGLMDNYSNVTEYPEVRRVGFEVGGRIKEAFHLKAFTADLKEGGGLVGVRGTYRLSKAFPLTLGVNLVADLNQYGGLKDKDGDDIPDVVDDFPDDKKYSVDSDWDYENNTWKPDGVPDEIDPDRDGDGYTDNTQRPDVDNNDPDGVILKPDPFNMGDEKRSINGISIDLSYPIFTKEMFNLVAYTEFSQLNYADKLIAVRDDGSRVMSNTGTGIIGPGIRAQLFKFLSLSIEYRQTSSLYQPGFFNGTYDFERAQFRSITNASGQDSMAVRTKDQVMIKNPYGLTGYFGSAAMNIFNIVTFGASYQKLAPVDAETDTSALESNSFTANLSVNTDFIPKLTEARAFYVRTNDDNPLDFANPSSNTTWGYRIGYEVAPGVSMIYNMQVSYRGEEEVRILTVETAFRF